MFLMAMAPAEPAVGPELGSRNLVPAQGRKPAVGWPRRRGFALVITLSLMILLTILAVGLLTLSAVSLRTAAQAKDQQTARTNARLAMMVAIGELQKTIGPDQRVTAAADVTAPPSATTPAAMPQWVGVYGNSQQANYADLATATTYPPATLLTWLVSGNEAISFASSKAGANFGKITTPPSSIPFLPTAMVSNIETADALSANLKINGTPAALLVGANSSGAFDATRKQFVAAPVVKTKNGTTTTGGYAYWVGDEGTKARINLQDNYRQQTTAATITKAKSYSMVSQRAGIECMRRDLSASTSIGGDYDPSAPGIRNLVSTGQFPLLNSAKLQSVAKVRFHDTTAYASSVLADCYAGGLKRNLSATIRPGAAVPANDETLFTPVRNADFGVPTWGLLRSWAARTAERVSPAAPAPIAPRPHQSGVAGFGPVISMCAMGIGVERINSTLRVQLYPTLVLWNPHAAPIAAADYELGMATRNGGTLNLQLTADYKEPDGGTSVWNDLPTFSLAGGAADFTAGSGYFRFRVQGSVIPPGESHIYALSAADHTQPYNPGVSTLTRGGQSPALVGYTRYLTGPSFAFDPASYPEVPVPALKTPHVRFKFTGAVSIKDLATATRFEAVLTEPGGLASPFTTSTPVYQALLDTCLHQYWAPGAARMSAKKLNEPATWGLAPIFAVRSQMPMEGRGTNSNQDRMGGLNLGRSRWIAVANPLAPYTKRTSPEQKYDGGNPVHGASLDCDDVTSNYSPHMYMWTPNSYHASIGPSQDADGGSINGIMVDVFPSDLPLLSPGQLQHAPLSVYGFTPTYCFGNSKLDPRFKNNRDKTFLSGCVAPPGAAPTSYTDTLYDLPWHLNRALWDRYFVTSVPEDLTQADINAGRPLPNARMTYIQRNGQPPALVDLKSSNPNSLTQAAAGLMVAGGFNINSTSVDAWRAVLTGTNQAAPAPEVANPTYQASGGLNALMPRFTRDVRNTNAETNLGVLNMFTSGTKQTLYLGNRELTLLCGSTSETPQQASARLAGVAGELAKQIVAQVHARGPFLSLADFINRDLVVGDAGLRGALQAAIDKCQAPHEVNPTATWYAGNYGASLMSGDHKINDYDQEAYLGGPLSEAPSDTDQASYRTRFDQCPKMLTQADVLTTLGPSLSARSDTFVIRCYGEATNPQTNLRSAGAWCEAVIQRTPDYVDPADDATVLPGDLQSAANKTFGRSLKIVSFRWLSSNEI